MVTQNGSYHKNITCSCVATPSTKEDEDGVGMKDEQLYKGTMPITINKCTTQKSRTMRTYLEEGHCEIHTPKVRTTRTYSNRQRQGKNGRCYYTQSTSRDWIAFNGQCHPKEAKS